MSLLALALGVTLSAGCRQDMYNQARHEPLEESSFFENDAASRNPVPRAVPRGSLAGDEHFNTGMVDGKLAEAFPFEVTPEHLKRGKERYEIYCAVCHGFTGRGNGMIVQRGFPSPPSYHIERLREIPVGHLYDVITRGYGVMYSYAARLKPEDRWAVVAYIRALQLSRNATLEDVPESERPQVTEDIP